RKKMVSSLCSRPVAGLGVARAFELRLGLGRSRSDQGAGDNRLGATTEVLAGEADGDRALADRGRNSFDRAAAHVADCKHARQTGFERVRSAAQIFPDCRVAGLRAEIRTGDDEAVAVQLDRVSQPL